MYATRCVIQQHADTQKHYEDTHFFATFAKKSIEEIERGDWREVVVITAATHGQLFVLTSPLLSAHPSLPTYLPPFLSPSLSPPHPLSLSLSQSTHPYLSHTHTLYLPSPPRSTTTALSFSVSQDPARERDDRDGWPTV